mmetsp:Transcript_34413/g.90227  ORF Transcript_34413/g.90227 Transcript_34413/m.90227 type:complete len:213 (+) Transcript_34413:351-989(+)
MAGDDRRPIAGLSGGLGLGVFIRSIWFRNNHKLLSVIPFELISTAIAQHRITPIVLLDAGMAPWAQSKLHTLGDIFGGQAVDLCVLHLLHALQQLVVIFPRQCVFELVCLQRSPTPWKRTFHKKLTIRHSYGGVHLHAFFANSGPVPRVANVLAVARDAIPLEAVRRKIGRSAAFFANHALAEVTRRWGNSFGKGHAGREDDWCRDVNVCKV